MLSIWYEQQSMEALINKQRVNFLRVRSSIESKQPESNIIFSAAYFDSPLNLSIILLWPAKCDFPGTGSFSLIDAIHPNSPANARPRAFLSHSLNTIRDIM